MNRLGAASWFALAAPLCMLCAVMTWVSASTLRDSWRTRDWVKVRAEVMWAELVKSSRPRGGYHYELAGQEYDSNRLGFANVALGIVDNWPADMYAYLSLARSEKRPIMVWMNPDNAQDTVVDRELHGGTVLLLLPFTLLCYGAAFLALRAAWRAGQDAPPREPEKVSPGMLNAFQYVALAWNCLTWLVALDMDVNVGPGRWGGLGILLPIAIGMVLAWMMIVMLHDNFNEE